MVNILKEKPLISVIVPVYNMEKYLVKCLNSIIEQTYQNLEIIVVNDCSTDSSSEIIAEFKKIDNRFVLVEHDVNRGLFQARLSGIDVSSGQFVGFVDSDDHISVDWIRLLVKKALETESDIVIGDFVNVTTDGRITFHNLDPVRVQNLDLNGEDVLRTFMQQQSIHYSWHTVVNKLYSKKLLEKCKYDLQNFSERIGHLIMTEDIANSIVWWSNAIKVTNIHNAYYYYCAHENQSTVAGSDEKTLKNSVDIYNVFEHFKEILIKYDNYIDYKNDYAEWRNLYIKQCLDLAAISSNPDFVNMRIREIFSIDKTFKGREYTHFCYNLVTDDTKLHSVFDNIKKKIIDTSTKCVSFDVFDTLILRPLLEPIDVFKMLNFEFNSLMNSTSFVDFSKIRLNSEKYARSELRNKNQLHEDVNIDEIYDVMQEKYKISPEIVSIMKEKEIQLEITLVTERKSGKELYQLATFLGKKIVFTSDMYLPESVIRTMLTKSGYDVSNQLFLSSEQRLLKSTGKLFRYVVQELKLENKTILHIGDNYESDIVMAEKNGLNAAFLPRPSAVFKDYYSDMPNSDIVNKIYSQKYQGKIYNSDVVGQFIGIRSMLALVANKIFDYPFKTIHHASDFNGDPYYIGYFALGMHLFSVTNWLLENIGETQSETIHFVSRDGYLVKQAYEMLKNEADPNSNYLHITRKSLFPLYSNDTMLDLVSLGNIIKIYSFTVEKFLQYFIVDDEEREVLLTELIKRKVDIGYCFDSEKEWEDFLIVLSELIPDLEKNKQYKKNLVTYLEHEIKDGDVLFDIGYSGKNEHLISNILNKKIKPFYIHKNGDISLIRSDLGRINIKAFYDYTPSSCVILREYLFSEPGPSCIGYHFDENGNIANVFEKYFNTPQNEFVINLIQNAALEFVQDMKISFGSQLNRIYFRKFEASLPYEYYLHYSTDFDKLLFVASIYEDDMFGGQNGNFYSFWVNECYEKNLSLSVKPLTDLSLQNNIRRDTLDEIYAEGLFVAIYRKLNKLFPKGSGKREFIKKIARIFVK